MFRDVRVQIVAHLGADAERLGYAAHAGPANAPSKSKGTSSQDARTSGREDAELFDERLSAIEEDGFRRVGLGKEGVGCRVQGRRLWTAMLPCVPSFGTSTEPACVASIRGKGRAVEVFHTATAVSALPPYPAPCGLGSYPARRLVRSRTVEDTVFPLSGDYINVPGGGPSPGDAFIFGMAGTLEVRGRPVAGCSRYP